jgi:formylglycine-generating enzyme required for sulfatase activity
MKPVPMTLWELMDNGSGTMTWQDNSSYFQYESPGAIGMKIDPKEVTNGLWDEVVQWSSDNNAGYTGLTLKGGDPDMPASNITYWQAIKWCNARSEMDGLTPAYYTDPDESTGDINGNGQFDDGPDTWIEYDPVQDPNQNGIWDQGEPFTDNNSDGNFTPSEYEDYNSNGQYDQGLSQVFRQGSIIPFSMNSSTSNHTKKDTDGYRLPSYPAFASAVTGGNYQKSWPWGDQSFPGSGGGGTDYSSVLMHQKYRISTTAVAPEYNSPSKASDRQPNGFDLYDMLGNLAEWEEHAYLHHDPLDGDTLSGFVMGGSYLGINQIGNSTFAIYNSQPTPTSVLATSIQGKANSSSNAIGFRCMVYLR